jgi:hypothetical protein
MEAAIMFAIIAVVILALGVLAVLALAPRPWRAGR